MVVALDGYKPPAVILQNSDVIKTIPAASTAVDVTLYGVLSTRSARVKCGFIAAGRVKSSSQ